MCGRLTDGLLSLFSALYLPARLEICLLRLFIKVVIVQLINAYDARHKQQQTLSLKELGNLPLLHLIPLPLFQVSLLPSLLARKRVWNPKYPICIQLSGGTNPQEQDGTKSEETQEEEPAAGSSESADDSPTTLYLFGRTGREKEEWFRHFLFASTDTEREKERDKPGRCVSRLGTRNINKALVKRSPADQASTQKLYICVDYGLRAPLLCMSKPLRERTDLAVVWRPDISKTSQEVH